MIRRTWRVLVVGAIAAAGLALPGTADAAVSACTVVDQGTFVPVPDTALAVVTGLGAIECLVSENPVAIGDLPDPTALNGSFIDVTVLYDDPAVGWQTCGATTHLPLVEGIGAVPVAQVCPFGAGFSYSVHLHAEILYTSAVTAASSTFIAAAGSGCVHPSPNKMVCTASS